MIVTLAQDSSFYILRAKKGAQRLGPSWPTGAIVDFKTDRFALIGDDWFTVRRGLTLPDVLAEAEQLVRCEGKGRVVVARVAGTYGKASLYEPLQVLQDADYTVKQVQPAEENKRILTAAFTVAKQAKPGKGLKISGLMTTKELDRDTDIVEPGAFSEQIQSFLDNPILLFNHNTEQPIGVVEELEVREDGVFAVARVHDPQIKEWIELGMLQMFSVSFIILDRKFSEAQVGPNGEMLAPPIRTITKAELLELSVVTIPANRTARFEVIKMAKSIDSEADIGTCSVDDLMCVCDIPERVVEYRTFPLASADDAFDRDLKSLREAYGERTADLCHTFETKDGPELQHAALVDGQLKTIPALVRLAMAQVVARSHDMTDDQRQMAWSSLGKRWMDCFPDVPIPTIDKYPAPGQFVDVGEVYGFRFDLERFDSTKAVKFARDHGLKVLEQQVDSATVRLYGAKPEAMGCHVISVAPGVSVYLGKSEAIDTNSNDGDEDMKAEEIKKLVEQSIKDLMSKNEGEPKTEDPKTEEPKTDDGEEMVLFDDSETVELEASTVATLEAARAGQPVSADALRSAVADGEGVLELTAP